MRFRSTLFGIFLLAVSLPASGSTIDVEVRESPHGLMTAVVLLMGEIVPGDAREIRESLAAISEETWMDVDEVRFVLASPGGDLYESMSIGRTVRDMEATVVVPAPVSCDSACVMILAAGVHRHPDGAIRIHRPFYAERLEHDPSDSIRESLEDLKNYLVEMNVPSSLAELMYSTPPERMRRLNSEELQKFRLDQTDFVYQEEMDLAMAEALGISRFEYLGIKRELDDRCGQFSRTPDRLGLCVSRVIDEIDR